MPLVLLLHFLGFHLENAKKSRIFRLLQSVSFVACAVLVSPLIEYNGSASVVVGTITYINTRCIYLTLIIIYIRNVLPSESWHRVFTKFDNIDLRLQTSFGAKINDDSSGFMRVMLLLLFISAFSSFAFECFNDKMFNVGQFVHAMLVFILSVKISFYCMLCASIKARFKTLIKYLKDSKSSHTTLAAKATSKYVATKSDGVNVSQVKEISLIYDEALEAISLLNESFSALLSCVFGKEERVRCENCGAINIENHWMKTDCFEKLFLCNVSEIFPSLLQTINERWFKKSAMQNDFQLFVSHSTF